MDQTTGYFTNLGDVTAASLQTAWFNLLQHLPKIIGALLILIIGWIVASVIGGLVKRVVRATGLDEVVERSQLNQKLRVSGKYKLLSGMIGEFVKWFIIIVVLIAAANTLNLPQVTEFFNAIALYIPRAIVAVIILVVGLLLGEFVANLVRGGLEASKLPVRHKQTLGSVAKYAIIVFSIMAALVQLNIVPELIQILFGGFVLALALAFGLGGREEAARFLASFRQER
ncbi:MAG: hypothetical protein V4519_01890 [Patescibacteria group bacterium]